MTLFSGAVYAPSEDDDRLANQIVRIYEAMRDGQWRTLAEIEAVTGDPPASISAQLRHLRKKRFGSYVVEKRSRGARCDGLFEYRVLPPGTPSLTIVRTPGKRKNPFLAGFAHAARLILASDPTFKHSPAYAAMLEETKKLIIKGGT